MTFTQAAMQDYQIAGPLPTHEEIRTGAILRIANNSALMAKRYAALVAERDYALATVKSLREQLAASERTITALRGAVTKAKQKAQAG